MKSKISELPAPKDRINVDEIEMARDFYEKVKSGEVTHGVILYRDKDGTINYQTYNPDHFTYILGLIERSKIIMIEAYHQDLGY